jgi:hypothetical protein
MEIISYIFSLRSFSCSKYLACISRELYFLNFKLFIPNQINIPENANKIIDIIIRTTSKIDMPMSSWKNANLFWE